MPGLTALPAQAAVRYRRVRWRVPELGYGPIALVAIPFDILVPTATY